MSQDDFGNPTSPYSGTTFFAALDLWRDTLYSMHGGNSRPAYAVPGLMWRDTTTTPWNINIFDGTNDVLIGTLNASTHVFTPAGLSSLTASGIGFTPAGRITSTNVQAALAELDTSARQVPLSSKSAAYTLTAADAGGAILHPSADTTPRIMTIPSNASVPYPIGTALTFVNQNAAGVMTIAITSDTMRLAGAGTTGSRTLAANGMATALKIGTTEWIISGTGLS